MANDLAKAAKDRKIKYFLISFVDLLGVLRAKLVPAAAIAEMQENGAGFAGFATWLDMTPAHPDMFAKPDPASLIQLPWQPDVGWLAADLWMDGKEVEASPRAALKRQIEAAAKDGWRMKTGVECEYFLLARGRQGAGRRARHPGEALLRPVGPDAPLSGDHRDLRRHAGAGLGRLPERSRGRQRPVRDELGLRRRPGHRRPARLLQVHGQDAGREARAPGHLHAQAVPPPHRQWLPRPRVDLGRGRQAQPVPRAPRTRSACRRWPITSSAGSCTAPTSCARSSIRP